MVGAYVYTYSCSGSSVEPLTMDKLSFLSNITEVDGYVQVENTNHAELTHLR